MAGSFRHCVTDNGNLRTPESLSGMLENGGDVFEAVEELYGMIWFLAKADHRSDDEAKQRIAGAEREYKQGLKMAKQANRS
jgi:hypothetical protein